MAIVSSSSSRKVGYFFILLCLSASLHIYPRHFQSSTNAVPAFQADTSSTAVPVALLDAQSSTAINNTSLSSTYPSTINSNSNSATAVPLSTAYAQTINIGAVPSVSPVNSSVQGANVTYVPAQNISFSVPTDSQSVNVINQNNTFAPPSTTTSDSSSPSTVYIPPTAPTTTTVTDTSSAISPQTSNTPYTPPSTTYALQPIIVPASNTTSVTQTQSTAGTVNAIPISAAPQTQTTPTAPANPTPTPTTTQDSNAIPAISVAPVNISETQTSPSATTTTTTTTNSSPTNTNATSTSAATPIVISSNQVNTTSTTAIPTVNSSYATTSSTSSTVNTTYSNEVPASVFSTKTTTFVAADATTSNNSNITTITTTNSTSNTSNAALNTTYVNLTSVNTTNLANTTINATNTSTISANTLNSGSTSSNTSVALDNTTISTNSSNSATNLSNSTNSTTNSTANSPANSTANSTKTITICNGSTPLYDPVSKTCIACNSTSQYYALNQTCLPIIYLMNPNATNLLLPNLTYLQDTAKLTQQMNPTRVLQYCPAATPYLQGNTCIGCSAGVLFQVGKGCVDGCGTGMVYNNQSYSCIPGVWLTSPSTPNLLSPQQSYKSWSTNIQQIMNQTNNAVYCPTSAPFSINGTCTSCTFDLPYFNIDSGKCEACGINRDYNADQRRCLASWDSSVSIKRMVANVL